MCISAFENLISFYIDRFLFVSPAGSVPLRRRNRSRCRIRTSKQIATTIKRDRSIMPSPADQPPPPSAHERSSSHLLRDPQLQAQIGLRGTVAGLFAGSLWNAFVVLIRGRSLRQSVPSTCIAFCGAYGLAGWLTYRRTANSLDCLERLSQQRIEGMHFMEFDSLAPPLPPEMSPEPVPVTEMQKLMKEADEEDKKLLSRSSIRRKKTAQTESEANRLWDAAADPKPDVQPLEVQSASVASQPPR
mmetsp:Transcript_20924/g.41742  ORF Transcript_20924/g.41742 Transcript_20924/m.41742 type:complete len:245 (-) Transcript_20924:48-782(-)